MFSDKINHGLLLSDLINNNFNSNFNIRDKKNMDEIF